MNVFTEGRLSLTFPDGWSVSQYDRWGFFDRFKSACNGNKGVDLLALDALDNGLWLIELKDYRQHPHQKNIPLWEEMALKVRDTLAGLASAKFNASGSELVFAQKFLGAQRLSVVLHLERPAHPSRLFGTLPENADLTMKLKQLLKPIDAHPRVTSIDMPLPGAPWRVESH